MAALARRLVNVDVWQMAKPRTRKADQRLAGLQSVLANGRVEDAWAMARGLLAARPRDSATLNLIGIAAYQAEEFETAVALLSQAAARDPGNAEIAMNLGNVLAGTGAHDGALDAYRTAHLAAPAYAEPAYNAGVMLTAQGHHAEAATWFAVALARDPDHVAAAIGRAEALRRSGDLVGAHDELAALIERRPKDAVARTNLAAVLSESGDETGARNSALTAVQLDPGLAAAHYNLGVAEQALGEFATAAERFRRALALEPRHAAAALNLGEAHLSAGDRAAATAAFTRALDIDPTFAKAAINLADGALSEGRAGDAVNIIDRFLKRVPGQPGALAFKAIALRDSGDTIAARTLDDPDRFIRRVHIDPPPGFADIADFNRALAAHVLAHPSLTPSPKAHATRAGQHSGELLIAPFGPMQVFADVVIAGFHSYRRQFLGEAAHPFLDRCPKHFRLSVWGVVMDRDGHQVPHIHPSAWLSGVYYVEVPETVHVDDPAQAGWIEFGRPPADIHATSAPEVRYFRPEPGLMVLFPSHFYHRTVPLDGIGRRISLAFDVMPSAADDVEDT